MAVDWRARYNKLLQVTKGDYERFCTATVDVRAAQADILSRIIASQCETPFGAQHHFREINSAADFQRYVPISQYHSYADWFERGQQEHFVRSSTTTWAWSSGTEHARKRLPLTRALIAEFERAIAPWLHSLLCRYPQLTSGPAYWIVGPQIPSSSAEPDGGTDDSAYFSPEFLSVLAPILVHTHPCGLRGGFHEWAFSTLLHLILEPDLTWLSVWSPTLLSELLESFTELRPFLKDALCSGRCDHLTLPLSPDTVCKLNELLSSRREASARQLAIIARADAFLWREVWPRLTLCSCWGDGWAALFIPRLMRQLPGVTMQRKGLLATEGVVSLPIESAVDGDPVLAVASHFFEFVDPSRDAPLLAHEVAVGGRYEVLLTTSGGLYRYALGDEVEVTGLLNQAPRVRFLGKKSGVSDLCGEKLHEGFVVGCLQRLSHTLSLDLSGATVRPVVDGLRRYYEARLFGLNESQREQASADLEEQLTLNPHYAQCRALRQLGPVQVSTVDCTRTSRPKLSTAKERVLLCARVDVQDACQT